MNQPIERIQFQPYPVANPEPPDDTIDLRKHVGFVLDHFWSIVGVAFVVTLLGVAYAFLVAPTYQANILIEIEDNNGSPRHALADVTTGPDTKVKTSSEMEILRSRFVVSRAVDNTRLYIKVEPNHFPIIGGFIARRNKQLSEPGIFGWGGYLWGMEQAGISVFNVPAKMENEEFTLTAEPDGFFNLRNEEFGIDVKGKVGELLHVRTGSGVIDLRVDSIFAKPGGQFTLVRAPRFEMIAYLQEALKIAEKGKQSGIISVVMESEDPKLAGNIVDEIGREYIRQNEERKSRDAEKSLVYLNTQLPELKSELERSESRLSALRNKNSTVDLSEEGKTLLQQTAATQTKLFDLKQKKAELLTRFNNNHPAIDTLNQLMRGATTELAKLDLQAKRLPSVEQDLLRLTRDVKVNTEVYTAVLGTAQQLRLIASSNVGNARLLDTAAPPLRPVSPRRLLLIALAGAVGLVLGVLFAFVRKTMFGRVDYPHEVEQILGLPVSATIYHSKDQKALSAQIASKSKELAVLPHDGIPDHAVESLRNLRSTLQFAMLNARNNIIMITGPTPGVGKSFVSANLTALLASIGKRVLLIDADLRTGYLHRYFGVDRENGLAEAIRGDIDVDSAVHRGVVEKVDFIATGRLPGKAAELLEHPNFSLVLARLSAQYDFVLIDTPPVLPFSDASIVGTHAGAIFNIVRGGVSTVDEIDETVKRLSQSGSTVTGTVFNDPKSHLARARFGARYGKYRFAEGK